MSEAHPTSWELLELLYDAPGSPDGWRKFLAALCGELSGDVVGVFVGMPQPGRTGIFLAHGVEPPEELAQQATRPKEPQPVQLLTLPVGEVLPIPPGAGHDRFRQSQLYREILAPAGVRSSNGVAIVLGRDEERAHTFLLILARSEYEPSGKDVELLRVLAPHLVRAARLHDQLLRSDFTANALLAALDQLVLGVFLLDDEGQVAFANRSAAELLGSEPGVADPALLGTPDDRRTRELRSWTGRERGPREGARVHPHPEDGRPIQVLTAPIEWSMRDGETNRRLVQAVFVSDPKVSSGDPVEVLRTLYGLTPAESRLAIMLLSDRSLDEAAQGLGITVGTARTTLKRIFSKTGTNRQASLVRLLLTGPGQLRCED